MSDHNIGQGARLENLSLTTEFNEAAAKPKLDWFESVEVLNFGKPMDPDTHVIKGPVAMKAAVQFTAHGVSPKFDFGFRQAVKIRSQSAFYAGIKDEDGSIVEGTTDFNGVWLLDITADMDAKRQLVADHAPWYVAPRSALKSDESFDIAIADHPGGAFQQKRRNTLKDRVNYLVHVGIISDFVTFLCVRRPDRSYLPVQGFSWTTDYSTDVRWQDGKPSVSNPAIRVFSVDRLDTPKDPIVAGLLTNPDLRVNDSMVKKVNDAMRIANAQFKSTPAAHKIETQGYSIEQFPNYTKDTMWAKGLISNGFFG